MGERHIIDSPLTTKRMNQERSIGGVLVISWSYKTTVLRLFFNYLRGRGRDFCLLVLGKELILIWVLPQQHCLTYSCPLPEL